MERFPGADSSTLTIPSIQMSNEGSYHCTVSNCAGSETSDTATLTVGKLKFLSTRYANEYGEEVIELFHKQTFIPGACTSLAAMLWLKVFMCSYQAHPVALQ